MPKITAISPQKRKGRFNVYVDGEFGFGIDEDTLVQEGLIVGKEISELEIGELEDKSEVGKLYQKALGFLEYRPRSEHEVHDYLKKKLATRLRSEGASARQAAENTEKCTENDEIIVERILKQLKSHNYLNDEEFAKWWVGQRRNSRNPRGVRVIQSELYRKGVTQSIIKAVLQPNEKSATPLRQDYGGQAAENVEEELALKAAQNYLKKLKLPTPPTSPNPWELKRKLTAYLSRRGFEWETIKTVVDKLTTEE